MDAWEGTAPAASAEAIPASDTAEIPDVTMQFPRDMPQQRGNARGKIW